MTREEAIIQLRLGPGINEDVSEKYNDAVNMAIEALREISILAKPSNTVEFVRCGECKHWYSDADTGMACEFTNLRQPEDGFCNWGERREP